MSSRGDSGGRAKLAGHGLDPTTVRLTVLTEQGRYEAEAESRSEALFQVESALPKGEFLRICHQCRFGLPHPIQGEELSCLKHVPDVADDVSMHGKYATQPLDEFFMLPVGELDVCKDFQRPIVVASNVPGTPSRV